MGCNQSAPVAKEAPVDFGFAAGVAGLEDASKWMTADEARLTRMLLENGQAHVFAKWTAGSEDKKHSFYNQVRALAGRARVAVPRGADGWRALGPGQLQPSRPCSPVPAHTLALPCVLRLARRRSARSRVATRAAWRRTSRTPSICWWSPPRA